jgi:prepilin-type N-terminal cleavage/methylation domain-containing protein
MGQYDRRTLLRLHPPGRTGATGTGAFTLIEILMVVVILAILAALVIPRYVDVETEATDTSMRRQLRIVRGQIELYRIEHASADPDMSNWQALIDGDYLKSAPKNPANGATAINGAGDFSGGWVWRDNGSGRNQLYATNRDHTGEYPG